MASSLFLRITPQCSLFIKTSTNNPNRQDWVLPGHDNPRVFVRERLKELALRQEALQLDRRTNPRPVLDLSHINFEGAQKSDIVDVAYSRCREQFLINNDPFIFGGLLFKPNVQRSLWAIWAWGRIIDEMVDGVNGSSATHESLDEVEEKLLDIYRGCPRDICDLALADTVSRSPIDIQLFKDVIDGIRVDLESKRFENIDEVYLMYYHIGVASFLTFIQALGVDPKSNATIEQVYVGLATLATGMTVVDMLRDIADDAKLGRIYFPKDELKLMNVSEDEIFEGRVTDRWKNLMRQKIKISREMIDEGAKEINELNADGRVALWTCVLLYRKELDVIEANDYDVFTKKPEVGMAGRILTLPLAIIKSLGF